jgi:PPP family 3-phenylpropionic acid transporter
MSSTDQPRFSPELRAAIYHFTVFGSTGVASVYFAIWLSNHGISADEIGVINAAPVLLMLAVNVLVGRIADRARDWRSVIIVLSLLAGAVPLGLFFVSGFWGILLVWTLAIMPAFALVPVVDAATLRMTQRRGSDFAGVRAWGTVGYMTTTGLSGPLIAWLGDGAFVPLFCSFALCRALVSLQLPQFRASPGEAAPQHAAGASKLREVLKPWFVLTLLGAGILYSTNSVVSTFAALAWSQQGISEALIGPLIAVMAAAEAVMMFAWSRLKVTISARHLIIIAAIVAAFRWTAMAFSPPVWVLFGLQLLHSITFAVGYFGTVYFIANWTSEDIAAEAQGFSYVLQQAMSVVALVSMGWFVASFGAGAWALLGGFALVGAALVWLSLLIKPPTTNPTPPPGPIIEPAP